MSCNHRFKHFRLAGNHRLTICIRLDKELRRVDIGYIVYPMGYRAKRIRQFANEWTIHHMTLSDFHFILSPTEPMVSDYITIRALLLVQATRNVNRTKSEFDYESVDLEIEQSLLECTVEAASKFFKRMLLLPL